MKEDEEKRKTYANFCDVQESRISIELEYVHMWAKCPIVQREIVMFIIIQFSIFDFRFLFHWNAHWVKVLLLLVFQHLFDVKLKCISVYFTYKHTQTNKQRERVREIPRIELTFILWPRSTAARILPENCEAFITPTGYRHRKQQHNVIVLI